ncbi:hypothetical protein B5X24_HaOG205569 [Helicoverpa armigera]|uniref:Uncharacterized protein n=1 Tax=Helicoverpa armigera TaxID=29058 RepID=A0A2W1BRT6_HELAM|nr:hypothetical protein B5X24_HaOG205569 [Helicoverpa armigera]
MYILLVIWVRARRTRGVVGNLRDDRRGARGGAPVLVATPPRANVAPPQLPRSPPRADAIADDSCPARSFI